jgi:hypothetical protein
MAAKELLSGLMTHVQRTLSNGILKVEGFGVVTKIVNAENIMIEVSKEIDQLIHATKVSCFAIGNMVLVQGLESQSIF